MNITNLLLILLGITLILCFVLVLTDKRTVENFDPVVDAIQSKLQTGSPEQLRDTIKTLQQRLIDYGYAPDLATFVKKTELGINSGQCLVSTAEDRDKYISKTDVPPAGPRIDLSQYVKKTSIPPEKVCPPAPTIDLSAYVKKSTLPPNEKCPPCIAPKVKVSAGLCRECPPAPPCPAPEPCPACNCPPPAPCLPQKECKSCDEIRYIKVPTIITKTVTVDQSGKIVSQQIDAGSTNPTEPIITTTTQALTPTTASGKSMGQTLYNNIFGPSNVISTALNTTMSSISSPNDTSAESTMHTSTAMVQEMPSTTFPAVNQSGNMLIQTVDNANCALPNLNSIFQASSTVRGRNESNFPYRR